MKPSPLSDPYQVCECVWLIYAIALILVFAFIVAAGPEKTFVSFFLPGQHWAELERFSAVGIEPSERSVRAYG
ncbi:hypothetical protein AX768_02150 [Burkholderia sp. PAMC 28687]|nr:hypothetical protein AX768_02150 [Burkholderia sp. PAMC 28687]